MGWQVFSVVQLFAGDTIINPTGTFVYSGAPAAGNLIVSIAPTSGTDQFGNTYQAGVTVYGSGTGFPFTQLTSGQIQAQATSSQFSPGIIQTAGVPGEVAITSGLASSLDSPANIVIDSANASGIGASLVSLQGTKVQLVSGATALPSGSQTQQGAAPAAYNQAYTQGTVNRVNTIITQLTQAGITN